MKVFHHRTALLGFLLLLSLAMSTTHDTLFDLLNLAQADPANEESAANNCQGDTDCEGCLCTCHASAESPQLDSSNSTQPLVSYLTTLNTTNYYSVILETLERPPEHPQA